MPAATSVWVFIWGVMLSLGAKASGLEPSGSLAPVRRIEFSADARAPLPEVHITPGRSTTFFFDARIRPDEVVLEGRERFERLGLAEDHVALIPSSLFREGERLLLELRFRDGAAPERAAFMLVVDAARGEPQVEVFRSVRPVESYRQEVQELKERLARLQAELTHPRSEGPSSWHIEAAVAEMEGSDSMRFYVLSRSQTVVHPDLSVAQVAHAQAKGLWTALRLDVRARKGSETWNAVGASLTDEEGRVLEVPAPWQSTPLIGGGAAMLVIMVSGAVPLDARRYVLKLWDAAGRTATVEGLTFKPSAEQERP
ncbi:hypothetical protein MYSTI_02790 [Myxococcus stipitatus DSM 14675]|uniref:DUF2381 family protein n=1 Tax=Myxococcus stipitatus (strain DSM 14675 / JCM 12634 / Mx s8) TaxID=1278073 RepID=L7U5H0_MYXSD|nr:DUF2381 family protein [Myxococcus stipitatus]AGC44106.1 hypothetical protein MYSTI_02790 [Myxococcus stipitatus DSM 14675]